MLLDYDALKSTAYNELKEKIKNEIEVCEDEVKHLEILKIKVTIWEDTLSFCGRKKADYSDVELELTVPEDIEERIKSLKNKIFKLEIVLDKLEKTRLRYESNNK